MPRPDQLSSEIEKLFGRVTSDALTGAAGLDTDLLLLEWIQRIGASVAAHSDRKDLPPRFAILGSDVANALTLPGSQVFVTRGLLDEVTSEDELAGVLAHEVGHVAKRHAWQQLTSNATFVLALSLVKPKSRELRLGATVINVLRALSQSRSNEYQADDIGLGFAAAAGYHPRGLVAFIERLASGPMAPWEEYFATHPPGPKRAERGRSNPLLSSRDVSSQASVAAGFDQRGLPGLAEVTRAGGDPLALIPLLFPRLPADLVAERADIHQRSESYLQRLMRTYRPLEVGSTLQQILLLTATTSDVRFVALATHAYLLQLKVQDVYARTVRLLRAAPSVWDALLPDVGLTAVEAALGRGETLECLLQIDGAPDPLRRAAEAATLALSDLNIGRFYNLSGSAQWTRIGAIEGLILYAERELVRADKASSDAWRSLSKARLRRYKAAINRLVPEGATAPLQTWQTLLERRLGQPVTPRYPVGEATVRALLSVQLQKPNVDLEVARNGGIPENVATVLRLFTLELERELAALANRRSP